MSLGAFADGIETPTSDIPVSGTASYFGFTSGTAIKGGVPTRDDLDEDAFSESKYFDFLGQVNLQADFATASVRGQVNNFQQEWVDEGEHDFLKNLTIDLGAASIVFGTFTGDARATSRPCRSRRQVGRPILRHAGRGRGPASRRRHLGRHAGHGRR